MNRNETHKLDRKWLEDLVRELEDELDTLSSAIDLTPLEKLNSVMRMNNYFRKGVNITTELIVKGEVE